MFWAVRLMGQAEVAKLKEGAIASPTETGGLAGAIPANLANVYSGTGLSISITNPVVANTEGYLTSNGSSAPCKAGQKAVP